MKSFISFLLESKFSKEDFYKHEYFNDVIADIIANKKIKIGNNNDDAKIIDIDDKTKSEFEKLAANDLSKISYEQFNDIAKKNTTPFRWSSIFKGVYSGHEHHSNDGEYAEAAVCYCFNAMNGNDQITEADEDDTVVDEVLKAKNIPESWIQSSKASAKKLHNSINNSQDYVAVHVDGKDISKVPENATNIAKIFNGKSGIQHVLKNKISAEELNNLYTKNKNEWNKADIIIVKKDFDVTEDTKDKSFANSMMFNAYLNDLAANKVIYPVSLKKVKPNAKLNNINFSINKKLDSVDIHDVSIVLPKTVISSETYVGSCYLKADGKYQIDFRCAVASRESLTIELKMKMAKGGKGLQQLKDAMKLSNDFYKKYRFASEDDFLNTIKNLTGITLQPAESLQKSDPQWYIRPCFKGLVGLLSQYQKNVQQNDKQVNLVEFFTLVYNSCTGANSESVFWKLSM